MIHPLCAHGVSCRFKKKNCTIVGGVRRDWHCDSPTGAIVEPTERRAKDQQLQEATAIATTSQSIAVDSIDAARTGVRRKTAHQSAVQFRVEARAEDEAGREGPRTARA